MLDWTPFSSPDFIGDYQKYNNHATVPHVRLITDQSHGLLNQPFMMNPGFLRSPAPILVYSQITHEQLEFARLRRYLFAAGLDPQQISLFILLIRRDFW
jgi:hypothetical protein